MRQKIMTTALAFMAVQTLYAGEATMDKIRFFDNFFMDAAPQSTMYAEGIAAYISDDNADGMGLGVQGGMPVAPNIEVGIRVGFMSVDYDYAGSESGLVDPLIVGTYHLQNWQNNQLSVGAHITLPVGDEDIGYGNTDIGVFGAIRHPLNHRTVLMGTAGLSSLDRNNDREFSLNLGGGLIYKVDERLHGIAELTMATEVEQMDLTLGADYAVQPNGSIRGSIDLGLDDGSADFTLQVGYLYYF